MSTPATGAIDAVLRRLGRSGRQLRRVPREAVNAAVKQLLALGAGGPHADDADAPSASYRIDDLAQVSGVTVRNIRAYQERGLLRPPQRAGRTALFDDGHLARLKIITSLLERGYTASNIREMLGAWENGHDLATVLGLESALVPPVTDQPITTTVAQARELAGGAGDYERLLAAGLVERTGSRARVLRPGLLASFAEMREHGMTTEALVGLYERLQPALDEVARVLVTTGAETLGPRFVAPGGEADSAQVAELVGLLTRFRVLAMTAVTASLAGSIEASIEELLADYLAAVMVADETA